MADKKKPAEHSEGGTDTLLWVVVIIAFILFAVLGSGQLYGSSLTGDTITKKISGVISFLFSPHLWYIIGIIASLASIFFIGVIVFCVVRMREIQNHEKEEVDHEIALALARD